MSRMKVYLSGGMTGIWQEIVKTSGPECQYLDPCSSGYDDPALYSAWDAEAVDACDVLFAYLKWDNPSGYGLVAELGRAAGLAKFIIFVDEKTAADVASARYLPIVRAWSSVVVDTLDEGIGHLHRFARIWNA